MRRSLLGSAKSVNWVFSSNSSSLSFGPLIQSKSVTITSTKNGSYIGFSVTSKPSWVNVTIGSNGSVSISSTSNTSTSSRSGSIVFTQNESGKTVSVAVRQEGKSISYYVSSQPTDKVVRYGNKNGGLSRCEVVLKTPSGKTVTVPDESGIQVEGPGKYLVESVTVYCNNGNTSTSFRAIPPGFTLSESSPSVSLAIS